MATASTRPRGEHLAPRGFIPPRPFRNKQSACVGTALTINFATQLSSCFEAGTAHSMISRSDFICEAFIPMTITASGMLRQLLLPLDRMPSYYSKPSVKILLCMDFRPLHSTFRPVDWQSQWYYVNASVIPRLVGYQEHFVRRTNAEPRITRDRLGFSIGQPLPISPRSAGHKVGRYPVDSFTTASFAGPIDLSTYRLRRIPESLDGQERVCAFVRLGAHISPPDPTAAPWEGVQAFHVLVMFALDVDPVFRQWALDENDSPIKSGRWLSVTGVVLGVLDPDMVDGMSAEARDDHIFVIWPQVWDFLPVQPPAAMPPLLNHSDPAVSLDRAQTRITDWYQLVRNTHPVVSLDQAQNRITDRRRPVRSIRPVVRNGIRAVNLDTPSGSASSRPQPRGGKKKQTRSVSWSPSDTKELILAVGRYNADWARMAVDVASGVLSFEQRRSTDSLRCKARQLKIYMLLADTSLCPGFDIVLLSAREREVVRSLGKDPDRREKHTSGRGKISVSAGEIIDVVV